ncbi:5'-flap endonuclease [Diaporthe australafricana]|uniref:Structure-specific endonuclease subunit SLX4 n=1 Tax=Diaporthe australafricana TaxID=127596 RepID=A0ABR3XC62_9PEZI
MARSNFIMTSPATQTMQERHMMLSSSPLPDIKELAHKQPKVTALRSGSAAAPIPASVTATFTSAADLLRSVRAGADDSADIIDEPERPAPKKTAVKRAKKTAKAPKRVANEVIVLSSDGVTPRSNDDGTITNLGGDGGEDGTEGSPLQGKPWRKYKAPVETGDIDISANAVEPQARPKAQRKRSNQSETASRQAAKQDEAIRPRARNLTPEPINLEAAVQRRMDWTPPKEDTHPEAIPSPLGPSDTVSLYTSPDLPPLEHEIVKEDIFKNLHNTYAHKVSEHTGCIRTNPQPITLGKRKVIEMTSVAQPSNQTPGETSPIKQKAPKKKPRTLTELATAAYAPKPAELPEDPLKEDSILEYFNVDKNGPASKPMKGKGKGKATKATKKKAPPKQPLLLSPKAAIRQSAKQDFVFGTSSQLVREDSPTVLRDLQAALRASNITSENVESADNSHASALSSESTKRGGGLWSVSARDEDGGVVDIEVIDLVGSPFSEDDAVAILDPWKDLPPELPTASGTETETAEPSLIEIECMPVALSNTSSKPSISKSHFFLTQQKVTINAAAAASSGSSAKQSFPLITDLLQEDDVPPPSNQEQSEEDVSQIPLTMPRKVQKTRPNYDLFTDAKLAKEVSSFGFKAVKTRSGMLALLDQCWNSRSQAPIAAASFSTSALSPSPKGKKTTSAAVSKVATSPSSKRQRAKPKKAPDVVPSDVAAAAEGASTTSAPKKRGRPRKDASTSADLMTSTTMPPPPKGQPAVSTPKRRKASTQPRAEIRDSDLDSDDSAGLSSPEKIFTSGGEAVDISINEDTEISLDMSPTAQQSVLFSHITRAVTSAPRTTDPENPSWHEKMLMYDPVILEDLAAWLNSGQLTRVGCDGEASPIDVKKWCESMSVCCLWRGTHRGKERKRL